MTWKNFGAIKRAVWDSLVRRGIVGVAIWLLIAYVINRMFVWGFYHNLF